MFVVFDDFVVIILISVVMMMMMNRWDADGPFKPLHVMNPTRLAFIRSTLCRHFGSVRSCPLLCVVYSCSEDFN